MASDESVNVPTAPSKTASQVAQKEKKRLGDWWSFCDETNLMVYLEIESAFYLMHTCTRCLYYLCCYLVSII